MIHILRNNKSDIEITGSLTIPEANFGCFTLERPDKNNQNDVSCIPYGTYDWVKIGATKRIPYTHISILNVPNRLGICIHAANFYNQLEGCIAIGNLLQDINKDDQLDVVNSMNTFEKMMVILPDFGKLVIE
jgi:hypothetical protein